MTLRSLLTSHMMPRLGPSFDLTLSMRICSRETTFHPHRNVPDTKDHGRDSADQSRGRRPLDESAGPRRHFCPHPHVAFIYFPRQLATSLTGIIKPSLEGFDSGAPARPRFLLIAAQGAGPGNTTWTRFDFGCGSEETVSWGRNSFAALLFVGSSFPAR